MLTYWLHNVDSKMGENKHGRLALSSKCTACNNKKSRFI